MADVEHLHGFTFDREQDTVDVRPSAVEQLTHFNGRVLILGGQRAPGGKVGQ